MFLCGLRGAGYVSAGRVRFIAGVSVCLGAETSREHGNGCFCLYCVDPRDAQPMGSHTSIPVLTPCPSLFSSPSHGLYAAASVAAATATDDSAADRARADEDIRTTPAAAAVCAADTVAAQPVCGNQQYFAGIGFGRYGVTVILVLSGFIASRRLPPKLGGGLFCLLLLRLCSRVHPHDRPQSRSITPLWSMSLQALLSRDGVSRILLACSCLARQSRL